MRHERERMMRMASRPVDETEGRPDPRWSARRKRGGDIIVSDSRRVVGER
jgi:hypothetical protein